MDFNLQIDRVFEGCLVAYDNYFS